MRDLNMTVKKDDSTTLGLDKMAVHRQAETDGLCHPALKQALKDKGIEVVGYDLLQKRFLGQMQAPEGN